MSFLNKVVLVTGGSSGIGAAVATKLSAEGAKVAIVGRNTTKLAAVVEECQNKPLVIVGDVTKEEDVQKIVSETLKQFGKIDVLVNNAGISGVNQTILSPKALEYYDTIMNTNMRSIVNLTNLAAPHLVESKGNIINISSVCALRPYQSGGFPYNVSKAALDHFTRCIAYELSVKGVRVNSINPGPVKTDIIKNNGVPEAQEDKLWEMMKKTTALGRVSEAEEVADLVMFLGSDKARGITGATFVIDNGTVLKA